MMSDSKIRHQEKNQKRRQVTGSFLLKHLHVVGIPTLGCYDNFEDSSHLIYIYI